MLFLGETRISDEKREKLNEAFGFLNTFLEGNEFVCGGENATLADLAILASITSIVVSSLRQLISVPAMTLFLLWVFSKLEPIWVPTRMSLDGSSAVRLCLGSRRTKPVPSSLANESKVSFKKNYKAINCLIFACNSQF